MTETHLIVPGSMRILWNWIEVAVEVTHERGDVHVMWLCTKVFNNANNASTGLTMRLCYDWNTEISGEAIHPQEGRQ